MVYRIFVEKKEGLQGEASALHGDLVHLLGLEKLERVRVLNRYDVEGLDETLFHQCVGTVLSEPQLDVVTETVDGTGAAALFAVEYLPGQFDQRANSAAECIQIIARQERPLVRTAKVYLLYGALQPSEIEAVKKYVINPVEAREAGLAPVDTLVMDYEVPADVATLDGFCTMDESGLNQILTDLGLAMDLEDIKTCQTYFQSERRDPTLTEVKMIDTYWSDHCRHTTFLTTIDKVTFEDELLQTTFDDYLATRASLNRTKPVNLMDLGTIVARFLKAQGKLDKLDESEEINACTVKIQVNVDGENEPWLLLFKNETHNHPTEIEPFGGAATCVGGAIRDPLSGRSYVYGAMRVTGAGDPTVPVADTLPGKLPQRKIVTTAAAGYSSYGNQIGLATGQVDELYHPGYVAKRMEIGAVIGGAPQANVRREVPAPDDVVILLGGRTGRDGCGGATGSSKSHTAQSLESCGAEVQKGNAPEERKLQRLFRSPVVSQLIKRCNDFGAGGVSVAIGELADGLTINLDAVPKKYEGLDGTELAISESQERMAVVVEPKDVDRFIALANGENLEATVVATVTEEKRLVMSWRGRKIVDVARSFLDSNGAEKHIEIITESAKLCEKPIPTDFATGMMALVSDLNVCSKRGLSETFDSTVGAGTVLMPFGGVRQRTPIQAMVHKISVEHGDTTTCSLMAWGYNPDIAQHSPYHSAYLAVVESVAKLVATGAKFEDVYLTFQEYFEKPASDPRRWGKPLSALLGAYRAQKELEVAAIGGKDSMSGSFENLDVPPTLVSFAVTTQEVDDILSNEWKSAGHKVALLRPEYGVDGLPTAKSLKELFATVGKLMTEGKVASVYTPGYGGVAESLWKMSLGNGFGFTVDEGVDLAALFQYQYGSFILELTDGVEIGQSLGTITDNGTFTFGGQSVSVSELENAYEGRLEGVYHTAAPTSEDVPTTFSHTATQNYRATTSIAKPRVLIPVFPGTNCEYDSAKAVERAGGTAELFVVNNLSATGIAQSLSAFAEKVGESQMIFIPGGFSGGDEPDGSGKFITAFFRNPQVKEATMELLKTRDGLMCGICNGFQALIKLGLVPYGEIMDTDENCPTLSFNTIARHQSKMVRTRVSSTASPWLQKVQVGDVLTVPISHGEGRLLATSDLVEQLASCGQIITQYVDDQGTPTQDIQYNPNGSVAAIEGLISPDGRVLGKMGHSERIGAGLYRNVPGTYEMGLFASAVEYYR